MLDYTYKKTYTKYFDYALITFGIYYGIKNSQLDYTLLKPVATIMWVLSIVFSLSSILRNYKWNLPQIIFCSLLIFIPLYLRIAYHSFVLASSTLILAAYNVPFSHISKMCIKIIVCIYSFIFLSLFLGVVEDRLYYRDVDIFQNGTAHDLGFKYYSYYALLGMGLIQSCIYLWRHHIDIKKVIFLITFAYLIFMLSSTRMQLYAYILFIATVFIVRYIPEKIINNKLLAVVAMIAYPLVAVLLYFVSKYSILSRFYDNYEELNQTLSGRLRLNEEAFMRYDVTLWGNDIEFETEIRTFKHYFYIDSGYLQSLLGDGLVFIAIILIMYCILTYKIFKAKAYYLYIWIVLYSILNITNTVLVNILANPILLLTFSDIEALRNDYYAGRNVALTK